MKTKQAIEVLRDIDKNETATKGKAMMTGVDCYVQDENIEPVEIKVRAQFVLYEPQTTRGKVEAPCARLLLEIADVSDVLQKLLGGAAAVAENYVEAMKSRDRRSA